MSILYSEIHVPEFVNCFIRQFILNEVRFCGFLWLLRKNKYSSCEINLMAFDYITKHIIYSNSYYVPN